MADENTPKKSRVDIEARPKLVGTAKFKQALGDIGTDLAEPGVILAAGGTAAQAAWAGMRGILLSRVLGPLGLITGAVIGIGAAMKIVVGQTQLLARGLKEAEGMESMVTMFRPLLGGAQAAKTRLAELFQFAASTPFSIKGIAESSRLLEIMTGGALSTSQGLRMIGDAAAIAGRPLEEVSFWVGRLYDALKSGAPTGEAMMRLQEMGVVSGSLRREIEQLTEAGAGTRSMWALVEKQLKRNAGGMELLSQTTGGLRSTLADAQAAMARGFGENFLEREKDGIKAAIVATEAFTPVIKELGGYLRDLGVMADFSNKLKQNKSFMEGLAGAATGAMRAFIALGTAVLFAQAALVFKSIQKSIRDFGMLSGAVKNYAQSLFASAAGTKTFDAAMAGTSIRAKVLAGLLRGLRAAVGLVGAAFKASLAALATPVGAIAGAIGLLVGSFYLWHKATRQQTEYLKGLKDAQADMRDEAEKQAGVITTVQQKMKAEQKLIEALVASYEALADAKARDRDRLFGNKKGVALAEKGVADAQSRLDKLRDMDTSKLTDERKNDDLVERLKLEREIADTVFRGMMERANGEERALLLAKRRQEIQERIASAEAAREKKRKGEDFDAEIAESIKELEGIAAAKRKSLPEALTAREVSGMPGLEIAARTNQSAAFELAARKARQKERGEGLNEIWPIELRIAALRKLQEIRTKLAAGKAWDQGEIAANNDLENLSALTAEEAEIEQSIISQNKERERAAKLAADQLAIDQIRAKASQASADGDMAAFAAAQKRLRLAEDALFLEQRRQELLEKGLDPATADKELAARRSEREDGQRAFRRQQSVEIEANEARAQGRLKQARAIEDRERLRTLTAANIAEGGMSPENAAAMAQRQLRAEIGADERGKGMNVVADSFRRIGLGGVAAGSDPAQRARDRTNELLKGTNKKLDEIINGGGPL